MFDIFMHITAQRFSRIQECFVSFWGTYEQQCDDFLEAVKFMNDEAGEETYARFSCVSMNAS